MLLIVGTIRLPADRPAAAYPAMATIMAASRISTPLDVREGEGL